MVVGSRGSQLALLQTRQVIDRLAECNLGVEFRVEVIKTTGDKVTDVALAKIGDKGLFVKEIEQALLAGDIDFAVHSAKDLPSDMDRALCIAAYPEREDPSDALVSGLGALADLPVGSRVGTSSIRRKAQLLRARPDLSVLDLRGNLDTRLRKLDSGDYDAIVLAAAGLKRMGWASRISEFLPFEICLPAVGQGALGIQCRSGDRMESLLSALDHAPTRRCVTAERALLAGLGAGCQTPVAALARECADAIELEALAASPDGSKCVRKTARGADPADLGGRLAQELLDSEVGELLEEARHNAGPEGMGAA